MKLQREPRPILHKGKDFLEVAEADRQEVEFDLIRDVPPRIWQGSPEQIAAFPLDLYVDILRVTPTAALAELRPEVGQLLKEDPRVEETIKRWAKNVWPSILGSQGSRPNQHRLNEAAALLSVFPELRSELPRPTNDQVRLMLRQAVKPGADLGNPNFIFKDGARYFINLLKMFPERRMEFRSVLDNSEFKTKFESALQEQLERKEFDMTKFFYLAQATILYPSDADRYKALAKPYWPSVKKLIRDQAKGLLDPDMIWAAAVLSAESAQINAQGNLELIQHSKLEQITPLPERPVA